MQVILAVIVDLFNFLFSRVSRIPVTAEPIALPPVSTDGQKLLSPLHPSTTVQPEMSAQPSLAPVYGVLQQSNGLRICVPETLLHVEPTVAFDNVLMELPYATPVIPIRRSGRWMLVEVAGKRGWVLADALVDTSQVLPQWSRGRHYTATDGESVKLRQCIADSFYGALADTALTGVEYVTYKLWCRGLTITWPQAYNRLPGTWQRKLRGIRGVHIDVLPKTGSIMEYIIDDIGYVAYVERVAPDLKITISGVGLTYAGQYTEQVLEHSHWRELRPVFLQIL